MYKVVGARNYPIRIPALSIKLQVANSLTKAIGIFQISGLYDAAISENTRMITFYGYNPQQWLGIWHTSFESGTGSLCRLETLFFEERGPVSHSAVHPNSPLALTVSAHSGRNLLLIYNELRKGLNYGGHLFVEERVIGVHWIGYLPLIVVLTENALKVLGPDIGLVPEDINSFTSTLSYLMNAHARYHWKCYHAKDLKEIRGMMHVHTFHDSSTYQESILLFTDTSIVPALIEIQNSSTQDNLLINIEIRGSHFISSPIITKHLLRPPEAKDDPFKICVQSRKAIDIYVVSGDEIKKTAEIILSEEPELVRVNNYQTPIIAIMNKARIVKMYSDNGSYLGFLNIMEIHANLRDSLDAEIKKIDMLFYRDANIQTLIILLNQRMVLLCNNYRYETVLGFVVVDVLDKPVPYCLDSSIVGLEQSSSDSIILCTSMKVHLVQKRAIKVLREGRKRYISLKKKLHTVNEMRPIYHPSLLREYLIFGDTRKLKATLLHLHDELVIRGREKTRKPLPTFLGMPVAHVLGQLAERKKSLREMIPNSDDVFDAFVAGKIKSELCPNSVEEEFAQLISVKDELIELIQNSHCLCLTNSEREELVSLISNLKVFLAYQKTEDEISQEFLLHMNVANVHWSLGKYTPIATMDIVLAYHCQNQDLLLKILLASVGNCCWEDVKRFGIPLWVRETGKLRGMVEKVAVEEYKRSKAADANRVHEVSIWYVLLKKKTVLSTLYKGTQEGRKISEFLGHDFAEERWKKAALRNAYQLLSQKKYVLAAAFYLLGSWVNEAVQVAITHLNDLYLAVTICRLMESEGSEELTRLYKIFYIDKGISHGDPWLVSLGNWLCGNHLEALNCIAHVLSREDPVPANEADPQQNLLCGKDRRRRALSDEWPFESPSLSTFNASMIVLCRRLVKHHLVTGATKKAGKHKSVSDSIFAAFVDESDPEEDKGSEVEESKELKLRIESLVLKSAQKYSKLRLPYLALYMIRGEDLLIKECKLLITSIDPTYIEKMTLSVLTGIVADILSNERKADYTSRYKDIASAIHSLQELFGTSGEKAKELAVEVMRAKNCYVELLYWYIQEGEIEAAFSLVQKYAVELTEFVKTIVSNPFTCDILGSKEGTQQKMLIVFHCIERLLNLMEVLEDTINPPSDSTKGTVPIIIGEDSKTHLEVFKNESKLKSGNLITSFNKMKVQIGFIVYVGLIMLSYGCNRYCRTIPLMTQLAFVLSDNAISWRSYIKVRLRKYIEKYRKTIVGGKVSGISGTKETMKYPCEVDKKKGEDFFTLWCRHIIMRKLALITKLYQDEYRAKPESSKFRMRISNDKDKSVIKKEGLEHFYEKKSYSLFQ